MMMISKGGERRCRRTITGLVTLIASQVLVATALLTVPVATAVGASAEEDAKCLKCHSRNLKKSLEDGSTLSLHIPGEAFADSVHSKIGCTGCHRDVTTGKHPSREPIDSKRTYAIEQNQVCRKCHMKLFKQYSGSIHATLVAEGHPDAPLCSDCHSAHTVEAVALYDPVTGQPCKDCHEEIYDAYSQSVHGMARADGNVIRAAHIQAPICADCHEAHEVSTVSATEGLQATCLSCHDGAAQAHADWLPNAKMHLNTISCAACHSPTAERRIDLQIFDKLTKIPIADGGENELALRQQIRAGEATGEGLDPVELWNLVRQTSQEGGVTEIILRGRMEVTSGVEAHRLTLKASATRDCESCHQGGSTSFENVTVSINRASGQRERFAADSKVLSSVASIDTLRDFYAPGGTRIRLLDWLLIVTVIGAAAIPIGHFALGRYLRKKARADEVRPSNKLEK
ncbi:MAG: multiheme c-type cytochrome [Xanthomonadales bacterium]|nr:multiheme c-type cytochrome [Xanthomonadales bacterium]